MRQGLSLASIWGHSPHYVSTTPNPRVTHALLTRLHSLVDFDVPMDDLLRSGEEYIREVNEDIARQPQVRAYVKMLEERYDSAAAPSGEIPSPEAMVKELEQYLESQRRPPGGDDAQG